MQKNNEYETISARLPSELVQAVKEFKRSLKPRASLTSVIEMALEQLITCQDDKAIAKENVKTIARNS